MITNKIIWRHTTMKKEKKSHIIQHY